MNENYQQMALTQMLKMLANLKQRVVHLEAVAIADRGKLQLSRQDAENIRDALKEWEEIIGTKELSVSETGLDWERYEDVSQRLNQFCKD